MRLIYRPRPGGAGSGQRRAKTETQKVVKSETATRYPSRAAETGREVKETVGLEARRLYLLCHKPEEARGEGKLYLHH